MELFGKVVKNAALMFTVGVLLAAAAPYLANAIGADALGAEVFNQAVATSKLWTGAFFSAFGAISAAINPVFDFVFGGSEAEKQTPAIAQEKTAGKEPSRATEHEISASQPRWTERVSEPQHVASSAQR